MNIPVWIQADKDRTVGLWRSCGQEEEHSVLGQARTQLHSKHDDITDLLV